jgi:hypothetical protein
MTPSAGNSLDLYHYSENGITRGPFTAQQLKELAQAGKIQPQTYVWKEGFPNWLPAGRLQGLFPPSRPAAPSRTHPVTVLESRARSSRRATLLVAGIILGSVLLLASVVIILMSLVKNSAQPEEKEITLQVKKTETKTDSLQKTDLAPSKQNSPPVKKKVEPLPSREPAKKEPPVKKPEPEKKPEPAKKKEPPPPPPVQFKVNDLLARYGKEPAKVLSEVEGKAVTLQMEGTWNVVQLEKAIRNNQLTLRYTHNVKDPSRVKPHEAVQLIFPLVNNKDKLGFFAKIESYARQRKKGERVVMSVNGILTTTVIQGDKFLVLKNAVLN